jgi:hypothetical protein
MNCAICNKPFRTADIRLKAELKGICLDCAVEGDFFGMTDYEINRCQAMLNVIADHNRMTSAQRQHQTDMGK